MGVVPSWTLSATGAFANSVPDTWTQLGTYLAPWDARYLQMAATDAEGLMLIMAGGAASDSTAYNDVWQLTWGSSTVTPLTYRLTPRAPWSQRSAGALYSVHDWVFVYGGGVSGGTADDAWLSVDYGSTWRLANASATGVSAAQGRRYAFGAAVVSRRLLLLGGGDNSVNSPGSSVFQAFW